MNLYNAYFVPIGVDPEGLYWWPWQVKCPSKAWSLRGKVFDLGLLVAAYISGSFTATCKDAETAETVGYRKWCSGGREICREKLYATGSCDIGVRATSLLSITVDYCRCWATLLNAPSGNDIEASLGGWSLNFEAGILIASGETSVSAGGGGGCAGVGVGLGIINFQYSWWSLSSCGYGTPYVTGECKAQVDAEKAMGGDVKQEDVWDAAHKER